MPEHLIKQPADLTSMEIKTILACWEIEPWTGIEDKDFVQKYRHSEFHFLMGERAAILCVARMNFDFRLKISHQIYPFAELVGFVSVAERQGNGKLFLHHIRDNMENRKIEALGFCEKPVRGFYEKCQVPVLYDQAKHLREIPNDPFSVPADDDIFSLTLSGPHFGLLNSLHVNNLAWLLPESE